MSFEVKFEIDQTDNTVSRKLMAIPGQGLPAGNGSNVKIHVTNLDSLDEYEGVSTVNNDYLPKLQSWINKKKYSCTEKYGEFQQQVESEDLLQLQVDIFKFWLKKIDKSDMEKIKEEMEALKHERLMIDREMKLFNFHFFSMTNRDTHMKSGLGPGSLNGMNGLNQQFGGFGMNSNPSGTIFSVDQLYHTIQCQGVVEVASAPVQGSDNQVMGGDGQSSLEQPSAFSDELDRGNLSNSAQNQSNGGVNSASAPQGQKSLYLIEMKEPLPQTALSLSLNNQGPSSKNFEVILYGTGCKNHIVAKMAKQYVRKTVHVDVTLYYYPINVSVKNNQNYTVYVPKQL